MFTKTISYEVICNPGGINGQYLISPLSPEWFSVLWKLVQVQSCRDEAFTQIHYKLSVSLESEKNNKKQLFEQTPKLTTVKLGLILEPFLSFNFQTNTCACHIHYPPLGNTGSTSKAPSEDCKAEFFTSTAAPVPSVRWRCRNVTYVKVSSFVLKLEEGLFSLRGGWALKELSYDIPARHAMPLVTWLTL